MQLCPAPSRLGTLRPLGFPGGADLRTTPEAVLLPQAGEAGPWQCVIVISLLFHPVRGGTQSSPHGNAVVSQMQAPNNSAITRERA